MSRFTIELTSVPHSDDLVAEVWFDGDLVAELRHEPDGVKVEIYATPDGAPWDIPYDDLLAALQRARTRMGDPPGPIS